MILSGIKSRRIYIPLTFIPQIYSHCITCFCQAGVSKLNEAKQLVDELKRKAGEQSLLLAEKQSEADQALSHITESMQVGDRRVQFRVCDRMKPWNAPKRKDRYTKLLIRACGYNLISYIYMGI